MAAGGIAGGRSFERVYPVRDAGDGAAAESEAREKCGDGESGRAGGGDSAGRKLCDAVFDRVERDRGAAAAGFGEAEEEAELFVGAAVAACFGDRPGAVGGNADWGERGGGIDGGELGEVFSF